MHRIKIALVSLICIALLAGCSRTEQASVPVLLDPAGVDLDLAEAVYMDLYTVKMYDSAVVPYTEEIQFTIDGTVKEIPVHLGQSVQKGDILLVLDEDSLIEERDELTADIEYYEAIYAGQNAISEIDIQIAETRLQQAKAGGADPVKLTKMQAEIDSLTLTLTHAKENQAASLAGMKSRLETLESKIGHNTLYAPYDGTIVYMEPLREESYVQAYTTLFRLADNNRLSLSGTFISGGLISSASSMYAMIGSRTYPIHSVPMDTKEYFRIVFGGGTVTSHFEFTEGCDGVSVGDYAAVCLVYGYTEQVLSIPNNAVYYDDAGYYVYLCVDNTRVRTAVKTGTNNGIYTQIIEGLQEGDKVYVKE